MKGREPGPLPFPREDLKTARRVVDAFNADPDLKRHAARDVEVREFMVACKTLSNPSKEDMKKRKNAHKAEKRNADRAQLDKTSMRAQKKALLALQMATPTPGPDASLLTSTVEPVGGPKRLTAGGVTVEDVPEGDDEATNDNTDSNPGDGMSVKASKAGEEGSEEARPGVLNFARKCHICHTSFKQLHHFYDQMCPECAELNWTKRNDTVDLTGRVCIITGARLKIGYEGALKLLRMGATVIATTRFPKDAALRYSNENDFDTWKDRLHVYGLDFRDIGGLHKFCAYVAETYPRLDAIINNAAQTVRKPPSFYAHLLDTERQALPPTVQGVVHTTPGLALTAPSSSKPRDTADNADAGSSAALSNRTQTAVPQPSFSLTPWTAHVEGSEGAAPSAIMSQLVVAEGDQHRDEQYFPEQRFDLDGQQMDLRSSNSWVQKLGEVSAIEMMECHVINTFAPFILNSKLKPLLVRSPAPDRYIVNVTAMEGQFYRNKTVYHPHTNMAKASLNMMTRTAAADYVREGIYMNCVDTGWITDESPIQTAIQRAGKNFNPPPLDHIDAAARIIDPIVRGVRDPEDRVFGLFLKDYKPTRW